MFGSNTVEDWSKPRFLLEHLVWLDVYGANSKCTHHSPRLPQVVIDTLAKVETVHMDILLQTVRDTRSDNEGNICWYVTSVLPVGSFSFIKFCIFSRFALFLGFASFLCSEIMCLEVERNQNGLSKVSFTFRTSNQVSQKTGSCNYTRCQYIKHWYIISPIPAPSPSLSCFAC